MPPSGHPDSYYVATANAMPEHPTLRGSVYADVCVIGGGFTGVSAALHLAERGFDVVLLEAARIGAGASGRNGGQLRSGQRQEVLALETAFGAERARQLWQLAEDAKALVRRRIERHAIACDLRPGILTAAHKPADAVELERTASASQNATTIPHARYVPAPRSRRCSAPGAISAACSIAAPAICIRSTTRSASRMRRSPPARGCSSTAGPCGSRPPGRRS